MIFAVLFLCLFICTHYRYWNFGPFWNLWDHIGPCWKMLDHLGQCWMILGVFWRFWTLLENIGQCWTIFDHFRLFLNILNHFGYIVIITMIVWRPTTKKHAQIDYTNLNHSWKYITKCCYSQTLKRINLVMTSNTGWSKETVNCNMSLTD